MALVYRLDSREVDVASKSYHCRGSTVTGLDVGLVLSACERALYNAEAAGSTASVGGDDF